MVSRLIKFEQSEFLHTPTTLAPICRKFPERTRLRTGKPRNPYKLAVDKMFDLTPAMDDRDTLTLQRSSC